MDTHKTTIDFNKYFSRNQDSFPLGAYPTNIQNATGILVKVSQDQLPVYEALAVDPQEPVTQPEVTRRTEHLRRSTSYLTKGAWGKHLYFTCLSIEGDQTDKAELVGSTAWDYLFKPGEVRLGRTGRTLIDQHGEKFQEVAYLDVTPDLVYDSLGMGGMNIDQLAIVDSDRQLELLKQDGERITSAYPTTNALNSNPRDTTHKVINLTTIAEAEGFQIEENPFAAQTRTWDNIVIFKPKKQYDSIGEMCQDFSDLTDNMVWKLASATDNRSSFLQYGLEPFSGDDGYCFFAFDGTGDLHFDFGYTGRSIVESVSGRNGTEWHNDQLESISLRVERDMIFSALMELGDHVDEIIMREYSHSFSEKPAWQVVHNASRGISLENRVVHGAEVVSLF